VKSTFCQASRATKQPTRASVGCAGQHPRGTCATPTSPPPSNGGTALTAWRSCSDFNAVAGWRDGGKSEGACDAHYPRLPRAATFHLPAFTCRTKHTAWDSRSSLKGGRDHILASRFPATLLGTASQPAVAAAATLQRVHLPRLPPATCASAKRASRQEISANSCRQTGRASQTGRIFSMRRAPGACLRGRLITV